MEIMTSFAEEMSVSTKVGQQRLQDVVTVIKPNSTTLAGSDLVRSWFEADSCQIPLH